MYLNYVARIQEIAREATLKVESLVQSEPIVFWTENPNDNFVDNDKDHLPDFPYYDFQSYNNFGHITKLYREGEDVYVNAIMNEDDSTITASLPQLDDYSICNLADYLIDHLAAIEAEAAEIGKIA